MNAIRDIQEDEEKTRSTPGGTHQTGILEEVAEMKDTNKKSYRDFIYNNPRADKQTTDPAEVQADK